MQTSEKSSVAFVVAMICVFGIYDARLSERDEKRDEHESRLNTSLFLDNARVLGFIPIDGLIHDITVLNNELFVVRSQSSRVNVYDVNNYTLIRFITFPGSRGLTALVASSRHNCLYVSDNILSSTVIHRYDLEKNEYISWFADQRSSWCYGLGLTTTHNLLVTMRDTRQIREFTPNGRLVREISLDDSHLKDPLQSVQLSTDMFAVCHDHQVCLIYTSGRNIYIIQCYGESEGSGIGELSSPHHLTADGYDNVLVADWYNNRVVLLSMGLTHIGYITTPAGYELNRPYALHLDQDGRRLYISQTGDPQGVFVLTV